MFVVFYVPHVECFIVNCCHAYEELIFMVMGPASQDMTGYAMVFPLGQGAPPTDSPLTRNSTKFFEKSIDTVTTSPLA